MLMDDQLRGTGRMRWPSRSRATCLGSFACRRAMFHRIGPASRSLFSPLGLLALTAGKKKTFDEESRRAPPVPNEAPGRVALGGHPTAPWAGLPSPFPFTRHAGR